jgi:hypothetical protein
MDLVSNKETNNWNTLNSFKPPYDPALPIFFIFLAPFGLPRPLFSWNFLLDSSINYYSLDFYTLSFRLFLLPFGRPRQRWSIELLSKQYYTFAVAIQSSESKKNRQSHRESSLPLTTKWIFWIPLTRAHTFPALGCKLGGNRPARFTAIALRIPSLRRSKDIVRI